ncbi:hypothetical protein J647_1193 [Acinetobacter baumannii 846928]|nr:hypothetical protein J647_1193 [Acinetobacter baumannii 846928]EXR45062.1 hypothetical protein J661_3409 [Acinetobacter baumannii 1391434]
MKEQNPHVGGVKVPYCNKFDADKIKQQLGIPIKTWDE